VHDALLVLGSTPSDFKGAFGAKGEVDPVRHLIGAAAAWGGNPPRTPSISTSRRQKNDGKTIYKLDVKDVPVDGFWSVTVYNAKGPYKCLFAQQPHGKDGRRRLPGILPRLPKAARLNI